MKENTKFENMLLLLIVILAFAFLAYAYYVTTDATMRGVILGAVIASLNTVLNWRFGSSKSSSTKDETISALQKDKAGAVIGDTVENQTVTIKNDGE